MPIECGSREMSGSLTEKFIWPVRVYYEDTDAGGVVYHANYLRFMERARNEWLRAMGHPVEQIAAGESKLFVVRRVEIEFRKPARLSDDLQVSAEVVDIRKASMQLRQEVRRGDDENGELLVSALVELAMVNAESFRPVRLAGFLLEPPLSESVEN